MSARLYKDVTANSAHTNTALGNEKKRKAKSASVVTNKAHEADSSDFVLRLKERQLVARTVPVKSVEKYASVLKVDDELGIVLGWAIVCKQDGENYWDLQSDHIPEDSMLKAAAEFMAGARMAKEMHVGDGVGTVVFAFPLTTDIAKAFGLETKTTGLMVAIKPNDPAMLAKFRNGTLTGFSIGGLRLQDEVVE